MGIFSRRMTNQDIKNLLNLHAKKLHDLEYRDVKQQVEIEKLKDQVKAHQEYIHSLQKWCVNIREAFQEEFRKE